MIGVSELMFMSRTVIIFLWGMLFFNGFVKKKTYFVRLSELLQKF